MSILINAKLKEISDNISYADGELEVKVLTTDMYLSTEKVVRDDIHAVAKVVRVPCDITLSFTVPKKIEAIMEHAYNTGGTISITDKSDLCLGLNRLLFVAGEEKENDL